MTQEQIKRWLPEIIAFAEGKTIQIKDSSGDWFDNYDPDFDFGGEYRIKPPEPRQFFVVKLKDYNVVYDTFEGAKNYVSNNSWEIIRVVEDLTWKPK